jgi:hypothetical protein
MKNCRSPPRKEHAFMQRMQQLHSMMAVASLKSYERLAEEHVARLKRLVPAFEKLYDKMPVKQKVIADQVFRENAEKRTAAQAGGSSPPSH